MIITVNRYIKTFNTRIYNLSSGPHITCFFVVIAKKRGTQQMTTTKLFHKHFNYFYRHIFSKWYYALTQLLSNQVLLSSK